METETEDIHVCLKCNHCIVGLENYVVHRKSQCAADNTPTKSTSSAVSQLDHLPFNLTMSPTASTTITSVEPPQSHTQTDVIAPGDKSKLQKGFTCPGCQQYFDVELTYLVHIKVCSRIEWPQREDKDGGETSDDNTVEYNGSPIDSTDDMNPESDAENELSRPEKRAKQLKAYGSNLDFRKCHPDGKYRCILCMFWTSGSNVITSHMRSKGHVEAVHFFVEKKFGSSLNLFAKNAQDLFECQLCGWQGVHRAEMEHHIVTPLHQDCILQLIIPEYSVFGDLKSDRPDSAEEPPETTHHSSVFDFPKDYVQSAMRHLDVKDGQVTEPANKPAGLVGDETDDTSLDEVDRMLTRCLVKKDSLYTCHICCYSTLRTLDMTRHLKRAFHNKNVKLVRMELRNGRSIDDVLIKKSAQWRMIGIRKSKEERTNAKRTAEKSVKRKSKGISSQHNYDAEPSQENSAERVSNSTLPHFGVLPDKSQVTAPRKSGRTKKVNLKYVNMDSEEEDDDDLEEEDDDDLEEEDDDDGDDDHGKEEVKGKRKRGRPRKENNKDLKLDDVVLVHQEDIIKRTSKRGRGRPKKDATKTEDEGLPHEELIERIPKRGRGRPRQDATKTEDEALHHEELIERIPKRGRGRPSKLSNKKCFGTPDNVDKQKEVRELKQVKSLTKKKSTEESKPKLFHWSDFICEVCDERFDNKREVERHIEYTESHKVRIARMKQENMEIIKCGLCPSVFLSHDGSSLSLHLEKHKFEASKNLPIFKCEACPFSFLSQDALYAHNKEYCKGDKDSQEDIQLDGEIEDAECPSKSIKKRRVKRFFCCHTCDFVTNTKGGLQDHLETMMHESKVLEVAGREKTFGCGRCGASFYTKRVLNAHLEKHTQTQQEFKICPTCGEQVLRDQYKIHCETTEGHGDESQWMGTLTTGFKCNLCDKVLPTTSALADHKLIHTGLRPFKCHMCSYRSRRKGDISIHIKRHMGIKPFKCTKCEQAFVKRSSLNRHAQTHDKNRPRPIECDMCDMTFYNRVILRIHKMNIHDGTGPGIFCQEKGCTFACRKPGELKGHMRSHTEEKPHLCSECGKSTATAKAMRVHQRVHTGEKPYKCTYGDCGYASRSDTNLRRHTLIHTGEKPYKCPHCDYRANVQENLRKHIKTSRKHKGMKMYKCSRCNLWEGDSLKEMVNHIRTDHGVYVKRIDVANETGIFQKNSGTEVTKTKEEAIAGVEDLVPSDSVSMVSAVGLNSGSIDNMPSLSTSQQDIITIPLVLSSNSGVSLLHDQHSEELVMAHGEGSVVIEPALSGQERGQTIQISSNLYSLFTIDPNDSTRAIAILK